MNTIKLKNFMDYLPIDEARRPSIMAENRRFMNVFNTNCMHVKIGYSEKATKFEKIFHLTVKGDFNINGTKYF